MILIAEYLEKLSKNKISVDNKERYFVYALWEDEEIIYIGQTTSLYQRIASHKKSKDFEQYSYFECADKPEMDHVESYLIGSLKPRLNKTLGSGMISLQKVRAEIRDLGENYKYSQKYYVNKLRKIAENKGLESIEYGGRDYVRLADAEKIINFAKKSGC